MATPSVLQANRLVDAARHPERIELVPELPMTTSGKASKPLMREIISNKLKSETGARAASAMAN